MESGKNGKKTEAVYRQMVEQQRDLFFMEATRGRSAQDMALIRKAYEFAFEAHHQQMRVTGEPYILHPIAVARIVTTEIGLGTNPIIAALLHDVVEDTPHSIEEVRSLFGDDVAFLVQGLTKENKEQYELSKQLDNIRKMLLTVQYDIRALLIKLADRLHNMRTLEYMPANKQMKIAGETDFFYAPLANRLGLYKVKTELENLSFKYRSPEEFNRIHRVMESYHEETRAIRTRFVAPIEEALRVLPFDYTLTQDMRSEYSILRQMRQYQVPFNKLESIYVFNIVYAPHPTGALSEKNQALIIYSLLTDVYQEKVGSFHNYIDNPKANGYEGLHCKFMSDNGTWAEVHIKSQRMQETSMRGCLVKSDKEVTLGGVDAWVEEFRSILRDMIYHDGFTNKEGFFLDGVKSYLYNDDIRVFTPKGKQVLLPQNSTALDFAYEIHTAIGDHAQFARVNGQLCSIKTVLKRGDRVEIGTSESVVPQKDWLDAVRTYKAKARIRSALRKQKISIKPSPYVISKCCGPLPGDELIGFAVNEERADGTPARIHVHKRDCERAIMHATEHGETIVDVDLPPEENTFYPARLIIFGVDRPGVLYDVARIISYEWHVDMDSLRCSAHDSLFQCHLHFKVRSVKELQHIISRLESVLGVEEVRRVEINSHNA